MAWTADRRLYWTADKARVVEEGDPDGAFLYRGKGQSISENEMMQYNIDRNKAAQPGGENKLGGPPAENKVARVQAEDADDLAASAGLGDDQRLLVLLAEQGVTRKSQVRGMSDEELDALDGVGPATLRKLREAVG